MNSEESRRILIVEDDKSLGQLLEQELQDNQHTTRWVANADKAIKVISEFRPELIVSDLRRAKQTAAPIVLTHPEATVIYEPRIRERSHGVFEGTPRGTFTKAAQQASIPLHSFKPQGGESILESRARARTFIDELIATSKGKNVLLVSHGGLITQMLFYLLGEEDTGEHYRRLHPANTALSVFAINDNGKHEVQLLNCVEHL